MCRLTFASHRTITEKDLQPGGKWITESINFRQYLIDNKLSDVKFFQFDKPAIYHLFRNYNVIEEEVQDEIGTSKPLSQRVIGAHDVEYDNNFLICRLFGYSQINLRLSHALDKPFELTFYCNDQQHAFMYEYDHINKDKAIDIGRFREALKDVIDENGIKKDDPVLLEINKWIKKALKADHMEWSQIVNSKNFPILKSKMEKPLMIEFTYANNRALTNKTQKINLVPYGWGDYQCLRNQLTNNEILYTIVFTNNGDLNYLYNKAKNCQFFSQDGDLFIRRQYFMCNAQPDKQLWSGEVEAAWLKVLISFLDNNGNIDFENPIINKKEFVMLADGKMYKKLDQYNEKWDKLSENLAKNPEKVIADIKKLRDYFFEYMEAMVMNGRSKNGKVFQINTKFTDDAKKWGAQYPGDKSITNIKDLRLTKLENALWLIKNSIVLSELYTDKTSKPLSQIATDYVDIFMSNLGNFLDDKTKTKLANAGSHSGSRYSELARWHEELFAQCKELYSELQVSTNPGLSSKHGKLFAVAQGNTNSFLSPPGYYFDPVTGKWLNESNSDTGHDLLSKWGRKADMETTFVQDRSLNRKYNSGNFPTPRDYYQNILKTYDNMINGTQNVDPKVLASVHESKAILEEVIKLYDAGDHLNM